MNTNEIFNLHFASPLCRKDACTGVSCLEEQSQGTWLVWLRMVCSPQCSSWLYSLVRKSLTVQSRRAWQGDVPSKTEWKTCHGRHESNKGRRIAFCQESQRVGYLVEWLFYGTCKNDQIWMKETYRKHLGRPFYRQSCIGKSHGEMRVLRHRNAEQIQSACGWRQGYG